jgi:uncharacterized OB-fold protein
MDEMDVKGSSCSNCSRTIVPMRETCPYCGPNERMTPVQLSNQGVILSYTILEMPTQGFIPPVMLALVKLDKGAVILALADKNEIEKVKIDTIVLLQQDDEGRFVISTGSQ